MTACQIMEDTRYMGALEPSANKGVATYNSTSEVMFSNRRQEYRVHLGTEFNSNLFSLDPTFPLTYHERREEEK